MNIEEKCVLLIDDDGMTYFYYGDQFNTLVTHVGDVENTLHDVNTNVINMTPNFSHFMSSTTTICTTTSRQMMTMMNRPS